MSKVASIPVESAARCICTVQVQMRCGVNLILKDDKCRDQLSISPISRWRH
jgi:hypothetical protein